MFGLGMKESFVTDSLLFTKYLLQFVCLLIFGFKILTYDRIQTTLREQERNVIKQCKSKEQFQKTVGRETHMFQKTVGRETHPCFMISLFII